MFSVLFFLLSLFLSLNSLLTIVRNSLSAWVWSLADSKTRPAENAPTVGVSRAGKTSWAEARNEDYTLLSQHRGNPRSSAVTKFSRVLSPLAGRAAEHQRCPDNRQGRVPHLPRQRCRPAGPGSPVLC